MAGRLQTVAAAASAPRGRARGLVRARRARAAAAGDPFAAASDPFAAPAGARRRPRARRGGGSGGGSGGGEVQVPPMPPPNESVEVFSPAAYARARDDADVPQDVIDSGHVRYHSLDELFPRAGLGDAWDTCAALRRDCRRALREDLAAQRERQGTSAEPLSPAAEAAMRALSSSLMLRWDAAAEEYEHLGAALARHGIAGVSGGDFMHTLGAMCGGEVTSGTLIDISSIALARKKAPHSWHQDSGLRQRTVLLGFPIEDAYDGAGVFTHVVKLSNELSPNPGRSRGAIVEWERFDADGNGSSPPPIAEQHVLRPRYRRGQEVVSYVDAYTLHSAPDHIHREALWRFM